MSKNIDNKNQRISRIINVICSVCRKKLPEHEKDINLLSKMTNSELEDVECISCEMKYKDSADIDMFGA